MGMKILDAIWNIGSNCRWYIDRFIAITYAKVRTLDCRPGCHLIIPKGQYEAMYYARAMLKLNDHKGVTNDTIGKYDLYRWSYLRKYYPELWNKQ